jgi:N-ethylmaleimide reductase
VGVDGVEMHATNDHLLAWFLCDSTHRRAGAKRRSTKNRARLLLEGLRAVSEAVEAQRTAARRSPLTPAKDIKNGDAQSPFNCVGEPCGRTA